MALWLVKTGERDQQAGSEYLLSAVPMVTLLCARYCARARVRSFWYVFLIDHGEKTPSYRDQTSDFVQTKAQTSIPMPIRMVWHEKSKHKTLLKMENFLAWGCLEPLLQDIATCKTNVRVAKLAFQINA